MSGRTRTLDSVRMRVVAVGSTDGIDSDTVFTFHQLGTNVWAEYRGGNIAQGFLVGALDSSALAFDYIQLTCSGRRDKGASRCELTLSEDGRWRLTERFQWASRDEQGVNVLEEIVA